MVKKEKKRNFESDALILPALKMVLTENKQDENGISAKNAKKKGKREVSEETVLKIIGKLRTND